MDAKDVCNVFAIWLPPKGGPAGDGRPGGARVTHGRRLSRCISRACLLGALVYN
jgi:hypothetical protein